jgi:hypothetical protein
MTVEDNLDLGAYLIKSKTEVERRKGIAFHRFPRLKERYRQLAGTLSGGGAADAGDCSGIDVRTGTVDSGRTFFGA